ncbi:MAG: hypothetical protein KBD85_01610 [Elusimicrobia bacterium]|nr:hypothetical protein [Elusimicrobiota bacterium]MBP9127692.1 hypothetical protein [Elusimicrobiota bacterium]MBP9698690.1 hypothetical protein [Elusimicrobiota bacterium]
MNHFDQVFFAVRDREIEKIRKAFKESGLNEVDITKFIDSAKNLVHYSEHCAEMVRQEKLLESEVLIELKRAHPGFSEETYGLAFNLGFSRTR